MGDQSLAHQDSALNNQNQAWNLTQTHIGNVDASTISFNIKALSHQIMVNWSNPSFLRSGLWVIIHGHLWIKNLQSSVWALKWSYIGPSIDDWKFTKHYSTKMTSKRLKVTWGLLFYFLSFTCYCLLPFFWFFFSLFLLQTYQKKKKTWNLCSFLFLVRWRTWDPSLNSNAGVGQRCYNCSSSTICPDLQPENTIRWLQFQSTGELTVGWVTYMGLL